MYIIDKNKDFYDHYSYIYGVDKSVTFDRKKSVILTDEKLVDISFLHPIGSYADYTGIEKFIILEYGNVQHLIKISNIKLKIDKKPFNSFPEFVSCKMNIVRTFADNKHYFKTPISIRGVNINAWFERSGYVYERKNVRFEDVFNRVINKPILLPILKDTQLTALLDGEAMWKELQNYLSALNNDKNVELPITDVEKAVNHGFDKKFSFRNVKKQKDKK